MIRDKKSKQAPKVNGGSMSDISFLLLTFFLLTSSIETDNGILRQLPPPIPENAQIPDVKARNVLQVIVNFQDNLMVNGEIINIDKLREITKEFFANPDSDPNKAEKIDREFETIGVVNCSKGVVSLMNDNTTSYEMYIKVQNELTGAFNELRDEFCKEHFGVKFSNIKNENIKKEVQKAIPMSISEAEPIDKAKK